MSEAAKPDTDTTPTEVVHSQNEQPIAEDFKQSAEPLATEAQSTEVLSGEIEAAEEIAQAETLAAADEAPPSVADLQREIKLLRGQLQDSQDKLARQQADIENARKRMQRELEDAHKFALKNFAVELLPVKDSMELHDIELQNASTTESEAINLNNLKEGSALIVKMLATALDKFNIEEINPLGERFNPEWHQAMSIMPSPDAEPNTVLMVHQRGYQLNGRLLRPALVIVSAAA